MVESQQKVSVSAKYAKGAKIYLPVRYLLTGTMAATTTPEVVWYYIVVWAFGSLRHTHDRIGFWFDRECCRIDHNCCFIEPTLIRA